MNWSVFHPTVGNVFVSIPSFSLLLIWSLFRPATHCWFHAHSILQYAEDFSVFIPQHAPVLINIPFSSTLLYIPSYNKLMILSAFHPTARSWFDQCSILWSTDDLISIPSHSALIICLVFHPPIGWCFGQYSPSSTLIIWSGLLLPPVFWYMVPCWFDQYPIYTLCSCCALCFLPPVCSCLVRCWSSHYSISALYCRCALYFLPTVRTYPGFHS